MKTLGFLYEKFFCKPIDEDGAVEIAGWLVIIDFRLFLIPLEYCDNYKYGEKIEFFESEFMLSIVDKILPL
ncbi:hypothetical protein [Pseudomonas sp. KCJK8993]|uniref:hypothetical protein n=1 Tax=Pseudomonas sp. KCJK8993 TaxID=3344565 RepID=UPI0039065F89